MRIFLFFHLNGNYVIRIGTRQDRYVSMREFSNHAVLSRSDYKGPDYYILVLECVYMRVSQIMLYMPAREMPFAWLFVYDNNENIVNMVAAVKCLVFYLLFNVCYFSPTTELLERVNAPFE